MNNKIKRIVQKHLKGSIEESVEYEPIFIEETEVPRDVIEYMQECKVKGLDPIRIRREVLKKLESRGILEKEDRQMNRFVLRDIWKSL